MSPVPDRDECTPDRSLVQSAIEADSSCARIGGERPADSFRDLGVRVQPLLADGGAEALGASAAEARPRLRGPDPAMVPSLLSPWAVISSHPVLGRPAYRATAEVSSCTIRVPSTVMNFASHSG